MKKLKNKIGRKVIFFTSILLVAGGSFINLALSTSNETISSYNTPPNFNQLMPDKRYLIIGIITDLYQDDGLIKFTTVLTIFIEINPFSLKTYSDGSVEMRPTYIGILTINFIFAIAYSNIPSNTIVTSKNNQLFEPLPGTTPPEIVFGLITNLDTREQISFTSTKRTWFVTWDYPFPKNFTIAPYIKGLNIHICPPMYLRLITPRFVFIIARGVEVLNLN